MRAIKKLQSLYAHVAYPAELLDDKKLDGFFANLKPDVNTYLESYLNVNLFDLDDLYSQLRMPNNKTEWTAHGSSALTNAFYENTENSIGEYTRASVKPHYRILIKF